MHTSNRFRHMLRDSLLQSLGSTAHVPTITVAQVLVDNIAFVRIVFTTRQLLPATTKDVLPASHKSNIVYQYLCHCDSRYVGRTSQRLQQRITQHVPKSVRGVHTFQDRTSLARSCKPIKSLNTEISSSAIGQHLLHNQLCAQNYSDDKFSILAHGRTAFHLLTLEATYIKTSKPNLCKQKEFVYSLKISH